MVARMTYFRLKWQWLPGAYQRFLERSLAPEAPVIVDDRSDWPVMRVGERHVFQAGAQGGLEPEAYLERPYTPGRMTCLPRRSGAPTRISMPRSPAGAPRPDIRCS